MKTSVITMLVVGAAVAALAFAAPAYTNDDPKKDAKATELEELKKQCETLGAELATTKSKLDLIVKYLAAQADAAKEMSAVLDEAEKEGFTFGINPNSRVVLLAGWRAQIAAQQELPGTAPKETNGTGNGKTPPQPQPQPQPQPPKN